MVGTEGTNKDGEPINPRPAPTPAAIKKMMLRDLSVEPPEADPEQDKEKYNQELFELYYSKLLPNAAGA